MRKSIVAVLIVMGFLIAMFFFGWMPIRQDFGGMSVTQVKKVLASQEISTDGGIVSLPDKSFMVMIPKGALTSKEMIEIIEPSYIPQPMVGKIVAAYEVLSKTEFFNTSVMIKFRIPNTTKTLNKSFEDMYTVMFYDQRNKVYVEVPCEYNSVDREISVLTQHFSLWALIGLEDYTVAHSPNFKIMFRSDIDAAGLGAREIYGFVAKVRAYLEDAYDIYVKAGFTKPKHKISVYVVDSAESYYTPYTGNIIISSISPSDNETIHEIAHELFHLFQNQDMNFLIMDRNRWWIEATADYVADKLAFNTGQMGSGIRMNYSEIPLTAVDGNHEYATALFVDWLVKATSHFYGNITRLWRAVVYRALISPAEASLDDFLRSIAKTTLLEEYSRFIDYLLFYKGSPIKTSDNLYPSNMTSSQEILTARSKSKLVRVSVDKPYSSKVIAVKCEIPSGLRDVILAASATEGLGDNVNARMYVLRDNDRTKAQFIGKFDKVNKPMMVRVFEKDIVYIVVSSSAKSNTVFNVSMIYGEIGEFPISLSNTYNTTIERTLEENTLRVEVQGSIQGPIMMGGIQKIPGVFGGYGAVKVLVHTGSTPTELNIKIKHDFAKGTIWTIKTAEGYIKYNITNVRYVISYNEELPEYKESPNTVFRSCNKFKDDTKIIYGNQISWNHLTKTFDYNVCSPSNPLSVRISIVWDAEITIVKVDSKGVEKIDRVYKVEKDYVPIIDISIMSLTTT